MNTSLSTPNLCALLESGHRNRLPAGQVMNSVGQNVGLAIVESGYIKRYLITREGNQSVQSIYGPGDIFPLTPVFRGLLNLEIYTGEEILYYEAMPKTTVRSVTMADLQEYAVRNQSIYKELFYVAGIRLSSNIQRLENVSLSSSYRRLAHQLACFAEQFGENSSSGTKILLPLTNSDLANVLNLTRETVSRSFSRLRKKGLAIGGTHIIIPDVDKLRQEIN